jgi:hypothetical protein
MTLHHRVKFSYDVATVAYGISHAKQLIRGLEFSKETILTAVTFVHNSYVKIVKIKKMAN